MLISCALSRSMAHLANEMRAITHLDFKSNNSSNQSIISEVQHIKTSFNKLKQGIFAMTKYIPKPVVAAILEQSLPASHLLGMQPSYLVVMFADLKGFTTISEVLPKDTTVLLLNQWLGAFTQIIHANHGTVDKYIGDCIMALFGAPEPVEHPEYWACKTALDFEAALEELNRSLHQRDSTLPQVEVRVGVHAGNLLIGNIGCPERVNFTVCGSTANSASRLEQLGKTYGVSPLVSGELYRVVRDAFLCVWVDTVVLRGYTMQKTQVYHLVATREAATPEQNEVAGTFHAVRSAIKRLQWDKAQALLDCVDVAAPHFAPYRATVSALATHVVSREAPLIVGTSLCSSYTTLSAKASRNRL
eukprot:TRINITY_DN1216_c0_g1_i3.p1 TRINITY_DN1216_c0_g1~~TRINITY_DN1216_c0_g1_i3.p1  ORF type:complete len:360 (+),score=99.62 TRINITY_DN1216_c0_g1_i3:1267-2346(+)